ncbi:hypothetical protein IWW50_005649, partial [Coemansia erecta]
ELKDKERHVLGRGSRDAQPATPAASGSSAGAGQSRQAASAEELKSRQERKAREERLASQYRNQLQTRMQVINDTAIDLGYQKAVMTQFERQLLGSSSPRELEQLELERINGVRSLIGLPALPPLPPLGASGSVRQSRPGTPMYAASSPAHVPSPAPYPPPPPPPPFAQKPVRGSYRQQHRRATSFGDSADRGANRQYRADSTSSRHHHHRTDSTASRQHQSHARASDMVEDDEEQDMDIEEGEISEEGELPE